MKTRFILSVNSYRSNTEIYISMLNHQYRNTSSWNQTGKILRHWHHYSNYVHIYINVFKDLLNFPLLGPSCEIINFICILLKCLFQMIIIAISGSTVSKGNTEHLTMISEQTMKSMWCQKLTIFDKWDQNKLKLNDE